MTRKELEDETFRWIAARLVWERLDIEIEFEVMWYKFMGRLL